MSVSIDPVDRALLDGWQRDFPLVSEPFAEIAASMAVDEADVLERLGRLHQAGVISRVGATCRPGTAGASTLAAVAAPEMQVDRVAAIISDQAGVNHSYLRENEWNIWFVATGPDRAHVDATLERIRRLTGLMVLDLPLVRPFNIDLGFALDGQGHVPRSRAEVDAGVIEQGDRQIMQALCTGLDISARPFASLAGRLGRPEAEVIERIGVLAEEGVLSRIGVIVRHRALGWRSNAMVVWQVPQEDVARAGTALAAIPGITLCYQRRPAAGHWPYSLYAMIHARTRAEAMEVLERARVGAGLAGTPHQVLFSIRCFKQTGALVAENGGAAA